ncbi:hypothetical protein MTR67_051929 [Solanum verrucosum]|uniref:DUF4218 domain-containing protein n=1 Tax=Solanum verrucosum TaxID=315347 RepID=A0AAF0V7H1_SOLVR|nr:hypothetical protein MTR67_051929 [Solanum verrucosum]
MDVKGKTKDNPKARMDIKEYCRRKELWLHELHNGKIVKPKASFSFILDEKREIIEWVKNLRMPEGYASNLGKRADMNEGKLIGMKSHDCHVFMKILIHIAFSHLPERIWKPITKISLFYKDLCSGKLLESSLDRMEENILVTATKLEKIFPCGFFDVMEHLPIHLVQEARLGGPVQTRLMINRPNRNDEGDIDPLFPPISIFNQNGRGSEKRGKRGFTDMEMQSAVTHILLNCPEIQSYVNLFVNTWGNDAIYTEFSKWLRNYVYDEYSSVQHLQLVKEVALGPAYQVLTMNKYCVNGFKFQTEEVSRNKKTNNSGVYIHGDVDGTSQTIEYYGVIQEIIEVRYLGWPKKKIDCFGAKKKKSRRPIDLEDIAGSISSALERINHDTHLFDVPYGTADPRQYYPNYRRPVGTPSPTGTSPQLSAMRLGYSSSDQSDVMAGTPPLTQHFVHPDVSPSSTATLSAIPHDTMFALAPGQKDRLGRVMIEPDGSSWHPAKDAARALTDCYWNTDKFKAISDQAKMARGNLKGGSLHTGGAKTVGTISREMIWKEKVVGGTHKGRCYGLGSRNDVRRLQSGLEGIGSSRQAEALDGVQIAAMSDQIAKLTATLAESKRKRVAEQESMSETVQQIKEQVMNLARRPTTSAPDDTDDESDEDDYVDLTP